ncbi:unnamed protein product, partial [Mesorhabditis spiculigera]
MFLRLGLLLSLCSSIYANVVSLDSANVDTVLKSNDVVFVNFYAEWCRFSQMLKPIYNEAAEKFKDYPAGKVVWASVDADQQSEIATRFSVNKYPTLKLFRKGELVKKEFRGQRSVEALTAFIQKQFDTGIVVLSSAEELNTKLQAGKRNVVGFFPQTGGVEFETFSMAASVLREDCIFHQATGALFQADLQHGSKITFQGPEDQAPQVYEGGLGDFDQLKKWLAERCVPLVREITFENAEELTEENLPFLILFRHPDDKHSEQLYKDAVIREIPDQKVPLENYDNL